MTSAAPAISLASLSRHFGAVRAVDALTFDVGRGELFGLVGPDGAGKTTTLRMLAGVLRPTSGDATVGGVSVARDPEGVKHRIAYMSQRFGLYTDLTVRETGLASKQFAGDKAPGFQLSRGKVAATVAADPLRAAHVRHFLTCAPKLGLPPPPDAPSVNPTC